MKGVGWVALAVAASAVSLAGPRAASGETETFTATMLRNADVRQSAGRTWPLTFRVEKWTSQEELARLDVAMKEGGEDALLRELQKGKLHAGHVTSPGITAEPSWRVAVATVADSPGGRVVRLITDRPVGIGEASSGSRSLEYRFAVFELRLDGKGRGDGYAITAARVSRDDGGPLTFETLPWSTGPDRLLGVRSWTSD